MTKREATRRDEQRRASAANRAEPGRPLPERAQTPPLGKELLSRDDLRALGVPWSRSRLYKVIAAGRFPRPVATGPNVYDRKLWRRQDVECWLRQLHPAAEPAE
jgi:predicted DNA-binding transcriptional regulator AlpA